MGNFPMSVSDIHEWQIRKLRKRKFYLNIIMITLAAVLVVTYAYYYNLACHNQDKYERDVDAYERDVSSETKKLIWVTFLLLAIILFSVGCIMICRLKTYYKDFYKDFGCQLWTANILMTLPLTFRALFDAMTFDDKWENFWFGGDSNFYYYASYNVGFFFFANYIPMLMQIWSLIFGFMRNKKVKLWRSFGGDSSK